MSESKKDSGTSGGAKFRSGGKTGERPPVSRPADTQTGEAKPGKADSDHKSSDK